MGFWDRHGLPDLYTGNAGGGVAPLETFSAANKDVRSMWASKAGVDGRPANLPGHIDDYWNNYRSDTDYSYEDTSPDPYVTLHRPEHAPDCIGDFIGLSQRKWTNMAGECDGNVDAFSFVYWDKSGRRRSNYTSTNTTGELTPDIQSGLRAWSRSRGYEADVFTQLSSFNSERTSSAGFTFADVKAEIDSGYPVLCFLQPPGEYSRNLGGSMTRGNPEIHGVLIYGYIEDPAHGITDSVVIRTSWGSGDNQIQPWSNLNWLGLYPVRGVIGYHPKPKVRTFTRGNGSISLSWDGPSAYLMDMYAPPGTEARALHRYQVEASRSLTNPSWQAVGATTTERSITVPDCCEDFPFFRVQLLPPSQ